MRAKNNYENVKKLIVSEQSVKFNNKAVKSFIYKMRLEDGKVIKINKLEFEKIKGRKTDIEVEHALPSTIH